MVLFFLTVKCWRQFLSRKIFYLLKQILVDLIFTLLVQKYTGGERARPSLKLKLKTKILI